MKSECSEYQKRIAGSLLGDLTAEEGQALKAHLLTCAHCRSEQEGYASLLRMMQSVEDDPVPRHFLIHAEERVSNPWQLFQQMKPRWQAIALAFSGLLILIGIFALSRLQIRSDSNGWEVSFGHSDVDIIALKRDILKTAENSNREARDAWLQEVRAEIALSRADLTRQQQAQLAAGLAHLESSFIERLILTEGRMRDETQKQAVALYRTVAQQRAQDLDAINLRFDGMETYNAIETRQTDAILNTLLQVAELRLR